MTQSPTRGRLTTIAVLVPVLGLIALIGRSEYAVRHGPTWAIPIEGYDPRDLLHGHYLQYRYQFKWQGEDTCGVRSTTERDLEPVCCLCLTRDRPDGFDPAVRQIWCEDAEATCDGVLRVESVIPPLRYYVPEDRAFALEEALRTRGAALELRISPEAQPAIRGLLLDGRPWDDLQGDQPAGTYPTSQP
jgi:uncharacterized membrane-anchored protein